MRKPPPRSAVLGPVVAVEAVLRLGKDCSLLPLVIQSVMLVAFVNRRLAPVSYYSGILLRRDGYRCGHSCLEGTRSVGEVTYEGLLALSNVADECESWCVSIKV